MFIGSSFGIGSSLILDTGLSIGASKIFNASPANPTPNTTLNAVANSVLSNIDNVVLFASLRSLKSKSANFVSTFNFFNKSLLCDGFNSPHIFSNFF